ncbi:MAG TPA: hypothetical protein VNQ90_02895 [Chthoniobacteraceae bacterium]|nr:hypothetical protein [Chthoniobacteraceae bacterium]
MKKIITTLALMLVAAVSVFAETPQSVDALVASLPENYSQGLRVTAVRVEARKNNEFYNALKSAGFVFQDVKLSRAHVVGLAFPRGDYDAFDEKDAAKYLALANYKSYIAARLKAFDNALASYDWLQQQRYTVAEAAPTDLTKKDEFLSVIAEQILAVDKAKR